MAKKEMWGGWAPDQFIDEMAKEHFFGKPITLDMLFAPHPDPHVRQGKPSIAPWFGRTPTGTKNAPPTVFFRQPRMIVVFSIEP